jgi:hypothetical protein
VQNDKVWLILLRDDSIKIYYSVLSKYVRSHGAISKKGRIPVGFIDRGVNINGEYYKTDYLEKHLLPAARILCGEE